MPAKYFTDADLRHALLQFWRKVIESPTRQQKLEEFGFYPYCSITIWNSEPKISLFKLHDLL